MLNVYPVMFNQLRRKRKNAMHSKFTSNCTILENRHEMLPNSHELLNALAEKNASERRVFLFCSIRLEQWSLTHIDLRTTFQVKNDPRAAI
jgi:hypothetical protein